MATIVKIKRFTDTCKRGHNRWGELPPSHGRTGRYCLDCGIHRTLREKMKKGISIGPKGFAILDKNIDFEISYLENQIADLANQIVELRKKKVSLREYYENKRKERKKAK